MDIRLRFGALAVAGAILLPGAPAAAQAQHFLAPAKAGLAAPGARFGDRAPQPHLFWGSTGADRAARVQYLHDVESLAVKLAFVSALEVRPDHEIEQAGASFRMRIAMSTGLNAALAPSPAFAANHGTDRKVVFDGRVDLPATDGGPWPAAWAVKLPLIESFVFLKIRGQSLVVDAESEGLSGRPWVAEGYRAELGRIDLEHLAPDCHPQGAGLPYLLGDGALTLPGQILDVTFAGLPAGRDSMRLNAFYIGASGRGGSVHGMRTPFDLGRIGVPTYPGCQWAIGDLAPPQAMAYLPDGNGGAVLRLGTRLQIPPYPFVIGHRLFGQAVAIDGARVFTTPAYRWTVGSGALVPASSVHATFDPARPAAQGQVTPSQSATLRLQF